jgi:hypothetical protein
MQMMQTRFDVETIKLLIKTLDVAPQTALTPHETIAAAELAARLRFRCVKLWGAGYDQADDASADPTLFDELEQERAEWQ